jgi:hypothetical protein
MFMFAFQLPQKRPLQERYPFEVGMGLLVGRAGTPGVCAEMDDFTWCYRVLNAPRMNEFMEQQSRN